MCLYVVVHVAHTCTKLRGKTHVQPEIRWGLQVAPSSSTGTKCELHNHMSHVVWICYHHHDEPIEERVESAPPYLRPNGNWKERVMVMMVLVLCLEISLLISSEGKMNRRGKM